VSWIETIDHPGYYQLFFSAANDQNWVLIADQIPIPTGTQPGSMEITLPSTPCTTCTLQLIQVMTETMSNYYSCADLVLTAPNGAPDAGTSPPPVDAGSSVDAGVAQDAGAPGDPSADAGSSSNPASTEDPLAHDHTTPVELEGVGCNTMGGAPGLAAAAIVIAYLVMRRRSRRSLRG
jgi:uncharacterized protein (TIGR03382 family)